MAVAVALKLNKVVKWYLLRNVDLMKDHHLLDGGKKAEESQKSLLSKKGFN